MYIVLDLYNKKILARMRAVTRIVHIQTTKLGKSYTYTTLCFPCVAFEESVVSINRPARAYLVFLQPLMQILCVIVFVIASCRILAVFIVVSSGRRRNHGVSKKAQCQNFHGRPVPLPKCVTNAKPKVNWDIKIRICYISSWLLCVIRELHQRLIHYNTNCAG